MKDDPDVSRIDEVRLEISGGVAQVTIDRQHVLNAIDDPTHHRLLEIWDQIESDTQVRVVVLTGAGDRAFCSGADMTPEAVTKTGLEFWADLDPNGFGGLSLRDTLEVPIIARVNGSAVGGGMEMVLGCDIVVAADSARFGLTEPRVGRLPLDGGVTQLVRKVSYTTAMGMLLTGRLASASEMFSCGLVNNVVPLAELDETVGRWVTDILSCAPSSVRAIKQIVHRTGHLSAREARTMQLPALTAALSSDDSIEGVRAFQEKRSPVWSGR